MNEPPPSSSRSTRLLDAAAVTLLVLAALFRVQFFDCAHFSGDEAYQYAMARAVIDTPALPFVGPPITGEVEANLPGGGYPLLMALPLLFNPQPEGPMVLVSLLGFAGLVLGWRLFRGEYGPAGGLASVALSAFNPFVVFHTDHQWNPNLLIPCGFLWLWLVTRAVRGTGRRPGFWLGVVVAATPQFHLSAGLLGVLTLVGFGLARPDGRTWRQLALGLAAGLLLYVPYLVWDGLQGFPNTDAIAANLGSTTAPPSEALRAVYYQVLYGAGDFTYWVAKMPSFDVTEVAFLGSNLGRERLRDFLGLPAAGGVALAFGWALSLAAAAGAFAGFLATTICALARRGRDAARGDLPAVLLLASLPVLYLAFRSNKVFFAHYTIVVFPLALVPLARLAGRLHPRHFVALGAPLLLVVAATQAILCARQYGVDEIPTSLPVLRTVTATILADTRGRPATFDCELPYTSCGSYPLHVLATELFHRQFPEIETSSRHYVLVAAGDEAGAAGAQRVWEIGPTWLAFRKTR